MTAAFDLSDAAPPTRARTETQPYGLYRKPFARPMPELDDADGMHDLAFNASTLDSDLYQLCGSCQHVRKICTMLGDADSRVGVLEDQLAVAYSVGAAHERAYQRERDANAEISPEVPGTQNDEEGGLI